MAYGTRNALAVTALNGLAAGGYWVSPTVDNSTDLAQEVMLAITILTTTTAGANGSFRVYLAGSDDNTNFAGRVGALSDATWTPVGDDLASLRPIANIQYSAETTARTIKDAVIIDSIPKYYKVVIFDDTSGGLGATTNAVAITPITF